ncbi:WxL protein peptidoglycan domain-containing protein [Conyzicola sp.]|uniref:WxL protein peptidoglycan domain-containing protein n=1 Tax=Conyzicola sp. TaxID=1969404 RepID=UPI003989C43A
MRRSTTLTNAALVVLLATVGTLAAVSPAAAEEADVSWGVRTAANDQGTDRQNFGYAIDPGASVADALVVSNHDTVPLDLALYGADGFTTEAGQLDVVTQDTESVALGAWIGFAADSVTVPAGESVEVPFTVTVPDNATPGDYAGAVITSLGQPSQEQGLSVDRRLGIRIHLRVGGTLAPALTVADMRVDYAGSLNPFAAGDATVTYTLENTGNARLTAGQKVTVEGPFGMLPADAETIKTAPELLPGESWEVTTRVAGVVPTFLLSATTVVTLESASSSAGDPAIAPVEATATTWAVPWALLVLLLLVAAIVVATILIVRRRRRTRKRREDERVDEAVQRALADREKELV